MAGVKGRSGRPGGNPDIKEYGFKSKGKESLSIKIQLRVNESQKAKIEALDNWRDAFRDWIDSLPDPEPEPDQS